MVRQGIQFPTVITFEKPLVGIMHVDELNRIKKRFVFVSYDRTQSSNIGDIQPCVILDAREFTAGNDKLLKVSGTGLG